jgi:hypothetical protein
VKSQLLELCPKSDTRHIYYLIKQVEIVLRSKPSLKGINAAQTLENDFIGLPYPIIPQLVPIYSLASTGYPYFVPGGTDQPGTKCG